MTDTQASLAPAKAADFPLPALGAYLQRAMDLTEDEAQAALDSLTPVSGGQSNPTYFLTITGRDMVLRKAPRGDGLPGAHAVDREFRVMKALAGRTVPMPEVKLLETDKSVLGAPFYLMRRVPGVILHQNALPDSTPEYRTAIYGEMARVLGRLHAIDPDTVGLSGYGRPGNFFERQIARWTKQWELSKTREIPEIDGLIPWLKRRIPDTKTVSIVHGDYRLGNVIVDANRPRITAVLDWELSTLGHPMADLAHTLCDWFIKPDEYGGLYGCDLPGLGIPDLRSFVAQYNQTSGRDDMLTPFHMAFATFRMAVIFEGIAARAKSGTASAANAETVGALAPIFAQRAAAIAGGDITF